MQLQAVTQLAVEREMESTTAPLPEDLLRAAEEAPAKPRYVCAGDYADTVHALRTKGFTWNEVTEWMVAHGAHFSTQAIIAGYRNNYSPQSMPPSPQQISRDPSNWAEKSHA